MPKISIIMPVYNGEKYLKESIESILNQTEKDFEFIIINDGSKDNSEKIIKNYKNIDNRIKYIKQENMGVSFSRNVGILEAIGIYIAFIDADDIWINNKLEIQLNEFQKDKELTICGTWAKIIDANSQFVLNKNHNIKTFTYPPISDNEIKSKSIYKYAFITSSLLIKKSILNNEYLFNIKMTHAEDYDFIIKYIYNNKCLNINKSLIKYRIHNNNSNNSIKNIIKHKLIAMKIRIISIVRFLMN